MKVRSNRWFVRVQSRGDRGGVQVEYRRRDRFSTIIPELVELILIATPTSLFPNRKRLDTSVSFLVNCRDGF